MMITMVKGHIACAIAFELFGIMSFVAIKLACSFCHPCSRRLKPTRHMLSSLELTVDEYINILPALELLRCFPSPQPTALAYKLSSTSSSLAHGLESFCILEVPWFISAA